MSRAGKVGSMAPSKSGPDLGQDSRFSEVVDQLAPGYKTIGQMVYGVLHEAIVTGAFAPGQWLRQEALAEAIGVSRIPVRSALLQLEAEGLVTFHPHHGARVRTLSPTQIDEIYRLRILLESYALRRSMAQMTPARMERIRELAAKLDTESEGPEFINTRVRFYREAYDSANSPLLVEMIEELRGQVGRYLLSFRMDRDGAEATESHRPHHHHSGLAEAISTADVDAAEAYLCNHLIEVQQGIQALAADEDSAGNDGGDASGNGADADADHAESAAKSGPRGGRRTPAKPKPKPRSKASAKS